MTPREQYQMAYRLLRLRVGADRSSYYQDQIFKSFGVTSSVIVDKAMDSIFFEIQQPCGWVNLTRMWEFEERRDGTWCEEFEFAGSEFHP